MYLYKKMTGMNPGRPLDCFFLNELGRSSAFQLRGKEFKSTWTKGEKWPDTPAVQPGQESTTCFLTTRCMPCWNLSEFFFWKDRNLSELGQCSCACRFCNHHTKSTTLTSVSTNQELFFREYAGELRIISLRRKDVYDNELMMRND